MKELQQVEGIHLSSPPFLHCCILYFVNFGIKYAELKKKNSQKENFFLVTVTQEDLTSALLLESE